MAGTRLVLHTLGDVERQAASLAGKNLDNAPSPKPLADEALAEGARILGTQVPAYAELAPILLATTTTVGRHMVPVALVLEG
jgi:hypothetical protein